MMRNNGDWMNVRDEVLLEFLRDDGGDVRPHWLAHQLSIKQARPVHSGYILDSLKSLAQAGYVEPDPDNDLTFSITQQGLGYLDGRFRADLLVPEPNPARPGYVLG